MLYYPCGVGVLYSLEQSKFYNIVTFQHIFYKYKESKIENLKSLRIQIFLPLIKMLALLFFYFNNSNCKDFPRE